MAYQSWSVVFGEQPSAAKWNILGTNDASFNDGSGIANGAITPAKRSGGFKVGAFATSSTGSQAITGIGFSPKAILFIGSGGDTSVTAGANAPISVGASDGTGNFSSMVSTRNGVGSGRSYSATTIKFSEISAGAAEAVRVVFTVSSLDADGFTVNITTHNNASTFIYLAFG